MGNTTEIAFLFPGQGSQYAGMGAALRANFPQLVNAAFEEADSALGMSLSRVVWQGTDDDLKQTAVTQPAILTLSISYQRVLESIGLKPTILAGHSLGEYSALVASNVMTLGQACILVNKRGQWMQEAVPMGIGAMAAFVGGERNDIESLIENVHEQLSDEILEISADNCPGQIVLSGHVQAIEKAMASAKDFGIARATRLQVSAPFHCSLLKPVQEKLKDALATIALKSLRFPYVANANASMVTEVQDACRLLVEQVCAPVAWRQSILALWNRGVRQFAEVGPGNVLSGLTKRILKEYSRGEASYVNKATDLQSGLATDAVAAFQTT